jgi:hypothetical protein
VRYKLKRTLVGMVMENEGRVGVNSGGCAIHQCEGFVMVLYLLIATSDVNSRLRTFKLRHILSAFSCFSCGTPTRHSFWPIPVSYLGKPFMLRAHALQLACCRNACCRSHSLSPPSRYRGLSARPHYSGRRRRSLRRRTNG